MKYQKFENLLLQARISCLEARNRGDMKISADQAIKRAYLPAIVYLTQENEKLIRKIINNRV